MFINKLQDKIRRGEKTVGTFLASGNASVAEVLAFAGIDYIIIDTEHGPYETESVMDIMRGAELGGTTALVRVKECSRSAILKVLDVGARGLIIPLIRTVDEVKQVVEYAKYYPLGDRGVCFTRSSEFGATDMVKDGLTGMFNELNERTMVIPQCETKECLECIEEVCAIDGVAGVFIGAFDLSTSMGIPGQLNDPRFQKALDRILRAAHEAGKFCIIFATSTEAAREYFARGFDSVTIGLEFMHLTAAIRRMMAEAKA